MAGCDIGLTYSIESINPNVKLKDDTAAQAAQAATEGSGDSPHARAGGAQGTGRIGDVLRPDFI